MVLSSSASLIPSQNSKDCKWSLESWVVGPCQIAQMESMFVGHFEIALNPCKFWRTQKQFNVLSTHTLSYLMPTFEWFLMTNVSARSILVNLSLEKKLTSNRPKPIGVLTRTECSCSDDRLPLGYLLPDFKPHRSSFFIPPPPPRWALDRF